MKCSRCQADNRAGVKFCENCGAGLDLVCPRCGSVVLEDKRFCGACGATLAIPPLAAYTSPHEYTPQYLAEQILRGRGSMEGERKQVTVLFADLRGSLELLADRDPEDAGRVLDPVLTRMIDAVHRYEGTVNQVMGDGIMALFGAPLAHEDHAIRACYAALRMQESVGALAADLRQSHGLSVQIRIGLNSGEVVVRSVGSDLRMDYTAVGQTTHLAARMEQLAQAGKTFLTAHTLRLAEGFVSVKPLGLVPIRGLSARTAVYELTGPGPMQSRLQRATARGLTRFVGRQAELGNLRQAMERAGDGHGQVVALIGEPGVGKSRLVHEFTTSCLSSEWRLLTASASALDTATAYLPIIGLLCGYFDIHYGDDSRRIRKKVTASLLNLDESLLTTLPALLTVLGVPLEDPAWQGLEPRQRRSRALEAIRRLLLRESQRRPLCLVIEDLHWIDPEAQAVIDALVEALANARILLLVTSRPECKHTWNRKTFYTQVAIHPLTQGTAAELLRDLLGDSASVAALSADLIDRTEGNPFFLEESVRHLAETGLLTGQRGSYRLTRANAAWEVPATVQVLLAARIDRLAPTDKRVLQCAAVIGKNVPVILLEAIADVTQDELRRSLAHLQAAEFLYERNLFPVHEYTFKHALTLDVAYGALLQERRRALHAQIVDALETSFPERTVEHIESLAYHAFKGEVWSKAVTYLRQAGDRAAARSLNREAIARFREALVALQHLGDSREALEQAIDIRMEIRHCLLPLGGQEELAEHLRQATELAMRIDDQRRLGWIFSYIAHHWWYTGLPKSAIDSGQRALAIADAVRDPVLRALTNFHLGQAYHALGDYRHANDFLAQTVKSPEREILAERFGVLYAVRSNSWLAWSHAELGDFDDGLAHGEEGIRIAEAVDQPFSLITAYVGVAIVCLRKGELAKAATLLERGLALAQARDLPVLFPTVASRLGSAYVLLGRLDEAFPLLERATAEAAAMSRLSGHALRLTQLAEAYLAAGRIEEALVTGRQALELSLKHQEGGYQAWALRLLAEARAAQKDAHSLAAAKTAFNESLTLAASLSMRPLVAHCHVGLSKVYRQSGEAKLAGEHLATGMVLYRAMNMRLWMERAAAEVSESA
jgi:class 3 adenylate cyclase/tetratricopeptide (TPR) repeat protein